MPIDDWTKVDDPLIFKEFNDRWTGHLADAVRELLPQGLDAEMESIDQTPRRITIATKKEHDPSESQGDKSGVLRISEKRPNGRVVQGDMAALYAKNTSRVTIRSWTDGRLVAAIEIVMPTRKNRPYALRNFLGEVWSELDKGVHLLLIDLFPPPQHAPQDLHTLIWGDEAPNPPFDKPLTLAAYLAGDMVGRPNTALVEPVTVGDALIDMPLFLDFRHYIPVPLEATYQATWQSQGRWNDLAEK